MNKKKHVQTAAELAMLRMPSDFTFMRKGVYSLLARVPRVGSWLSRLYVKLWNPINYAVIGGIGVCINYVIWLVTMPILPWFLSNILAILIAWMWNWSQAVGHFSYIWGFKKHEQKET